MTEADTGEGKIGKRKLEGTFHSRWRGKIELPNQPDSLELKYSLHLPEMNPGEIVPTVVLLHGASTPQGRGRVLFEELQDKLADAGYASFAYDTRGVGESNGEYQDSTLRARFSDLTMALDCVEDNKNILDRNKLVLFGLSMGGHVATKILFLEPDVYRAVILVNPAAYAKDAEDKKLKPSTEFTEAIREPESWQSSTAFEDISMYDGPVMMVDSELDDVIEPAIKKAYRRSINDLRTHLVLPGVKHAIFSGKDEQSYEARESLYREIISFLEGLNLK